jgi:Flp pilus assembly pilin Flp
MTSVEYAVLAGFIIAVCAAAVAAFQDPAGSARATTGASVGTYAARFSWAARSASGLQWAG